MIPAQFEYVAPTSLAEAVTAHARQQRYSFVGPVTVRFEEDEELELVEPLEPVSFDPPVDEPVVLDDEPPVPEESPRESVR